MVQACKSINHRPYLHLQKPLWDTCAVCYCLLAYCLGILFITRSHFGLNIIGVLLLSHGLIYSAYLSHEFMHGNIFRQRRWDTAFGILMLWLNGGCYYGFKALLKQHFEHHIRQADVITFDIPTTLQQKNQLIRQGILILEWCYFPIVAFWARWRAVKLLWQTSNYSQRLRFLFVLMVRGILFTLLGIVSPKGLLLYFVSYLGMITVLRWMDTFQHTYEGFASSDQIPKYVSNYEQTHTFSNLVSSQHPLLNLLFLNFCYHNAHHAVMQCPWHSLHKLDRELNLTNPVPNIPLSQQLKNFHRFRITRLLEGQGTVMLSPGKPDFNNFYGAADVSFITLY